ncbi:MAG: agmatine deiminase family protein [Candidatus Aureabacteria bacterium]|nr:agmatine deiminase family protein [Candidatus Auribacterota bacterium]
MNDSRQSPYFMPAEWNIHRGTLIAWPTNPETWKGTEHQVQEDMAVLASAISQFEDVYISTKPLDDKQAILQSVIHQGGHLSRIHFPPVSNNDCWMRDTGPNYVWSHSEKKNWAITNWGYNAWGGKYPPWDDDNQIKKRFAEWIGCPALLEPEMILEGGSIDVNGEEVLLTTKSCLLNPNRNPHLNQKSIENKLRQYLGIRKIIWLEQGIAGDDTDGHIDDFARFVNPHIIVCSHEEDPKDENFEPLDEAYKQLLSETNLMGKPFHIVKLPMPEPKYFQDFRIPASYANFYFANQILVLPVFNDPKDKVAMEILTRLCPERKIIPVPGLTFVRGLGGVHCLTQQIY